MSLPDQDELQFLRKRLQGALADIATLDGTIAALRHNLREQDELLEHRTAELNRLREEKRRAWGEVLKSGDSA